MLKADRFQKLLTLLKANVTIRSTEIMEKIPVSNMTVRRDLDKRER
ncbi:hypothetical protein NRIC_14600 [Enterococcus florum]|uniref:HTH deoR-type domain-containing protein n=1 Tax=Enterococcus florum TaxID=2480627 RepID=A0A4V0WPE4_9ENTE|nr:DeoR family transcriptional regulator [Enterococcus florum]GCF93569.1 hypothetical protein NRIC_14600 [Enterococcus florum]